MRCEAPGPFWPRLTPTPEHLPWIYPPAPWFRLSPTNQPVFVSLLSSEVVVLVVTMETCRQIQTCLTTTQLPCQLICPLPSLHMQVCPVDLPLPHRPVHVSPAAPGWQPQLPYQYNDGGLQTDSPSHHHSAPIPIDLSPSTLHTQDKPVHLPLPPRPVHVSPAARCGGLGCYTADMLKPGMRSQS